MTPAGDLIPWPQTQTPPTPTPVFVEKNKVKFPELAQNANTKNLRRLNSIGCTRNGANIQLFQAGGLLRRRVPAVPRAWGPG
jgi:hypothetical protein